MPTSATKPCSLSRTQAWPGDSSPTILPISTWPTANSTTSVSSQMQSARSGISAGTVCEFACRKRADASLRPYKGLGRTTGSSSPAERGISSPRDQRQPAAAGILLDRGECGQVYSTMMWEFSSTVMALLPADLVAALTRRLPVRMSIRPLVLQRR